MQLPSSPLPLTTRPSSIPPKPTLNRDLSLLPTPPRSSSPIASQAYTSTPLPLSAKRQRSISSEFVDTFDTSNDQTGSASTTFTKDTSNENVSEGVPASDARVNPSIPKEKFVAGLVGASVIAIESIWGPSNPSSSDPASQFSQQPQVMPLQGFVREVLRRSRTSCSTLQVSLFYLHKCRKEIRGIVARASSINNSRAKEGMSEMSSMGKDGIDEEMKAAAQAYPSPPHSPSDEPPSPSHSSSVSSASKSSEFLRNANNPLLCGRRIFLAALMCASKFLQDRNYSNKAWAKISGLDIREVNENERVFLGLMRWDLCLAVEDFYKWTERLASLAQQGAALEIATSAPVTIPSALRNRLALARHSTEYPPAPALNEMKRSSAASATRVLPTEGEPRTVGRSYSDPDFAAKLRQSQAIGRGCIVDRHPAQAYTQSEKTGTMITGSYPFPIVASPERMASTPIAHRGTKRYDTPLPMQQPTPMPSPASTDSASSSSGSAASSPVSGYSCHPGSSSSSMSDFGGEVTRRASKRMKMSRQSTPVDSSAIDKMSLDDALPTVIV